MTEQQQNAADLATTLQVMEIERFAVHDGPGIRTVVFLQGCPLRCPWCANPESQRVAKQLLHSKAKCCKCGACAAACPDGAITHSPGQYPDIDRLRDACCGACVAACPTGALQLSGTEMTVAEILDTVLRDAPYYQSSGGGLTVSGGEPMFQFIGFLALVRAAKQKGLNVAVETCGQVPPAHLEAAEPYVDHFLYDYKHSDVTLLRQIAGADFTLIHANLQWLCQTAPQKVVLRCPVIPGFNAEPAVMDEIFDTALELGLKEIHLLGYHTLGAEKYERLGRRYTWPVQEMLSEETLLAFKKQGEEKGLWVITGE